MNSGPKMSAFALAVLLVCANANAQGTAAPNAVPAVDAVRSAAQKAIAGNPELTARLNALRASSSAVDAARGGLYPKVDLEAAAGRTNDRITTRNPEAQSLTRSGVALSLTQLLWDANVVRSDIERLGHDKLVRWFELLDATEKIGRASCRERV